MTTVIPVILSGGSGSRLWPISRHHYPKQLHKLHGDHTMLQETLLRVSHLESDPVVICNNDQRFMVAEQVKQMGLNAKIILEPVARNTAPAIAVAALQAVQVDPQAIIAIFPADHIVKNQAAFMDALEKAVQCAKDGELVTFGVQPTRPETGYGYIKACGLGASKVEAFKEKPDLETAKEYILSGNYYWNSGMFVFLADKLISELQKFQPDMVEHCQAAFLASQNDLDFTRLAEAAFSKCENLSIDYALMERTDKAFTVPLDAGWSDVGSWQALWDVGEKDDCGNVKTGDTYLQDSRDCYVKATHRMVALIGLDNVVVVETADALLVADKDASQKVKDVVNHLKAGKRPEYEFHREVFRPWGSYDSVEEGDRYKVKRITVKPGAQLSLQMHHHRAEHWVVVAGTAVVQKGDKEVLLTENESIYIPLGEKHRLKNPGKVSLHLIEVQSGPYLGEDDILRFEDAFGRK